MFDTQIIQLDPNKTSGSIVVNIPFTASYFAVMNPTGADLHIANGLPGSQPPDAILVSNGDTVSLTTQPTNTQTVFWSGTVLTGNITVTFQYSDQPIPASVANRTVNVVGSVGLTGTPNVNIGNTPAVTIASGNVNTNTLVINESSQSVPVQQQSYYGSSADGVFNPFSNYPSLQTTDLTLISGTYTDNGDGSYKGVNVVSQFRGATNFQVKKRFKFPSSPANGAYVKLCPTQTNIPNGSDGYQLIWQYDNNIVLAQTVGSTTSLAWSAQTIGFPVPVVGHIYLFTLSLFSSSSTIYIVASVFDETNNSTVWSTTINAGSYVQPWKFIEEFGTGASNTTVYYSDFYPLYLFNNTANQADIKNFSSVNIPSNVIVAWANLAEYTTWFVNGDCTINGTIQAANALPSASSNAQIAIFNGSIIVSKGGNGGNGGQGGSNSNGTPSPQPGGSGGAASAYGSGSGGGGGGGNFGNMAGATAGSAGSNGYGTATGGTGGPGYGGSGAGGNGQSATGGSTATLITIANGNINVIGTINSSGGIGGNGGGQGSPNGSQQGGCGAGGAGAGVNGNGGQGQAAFSNTGWAPSAGGGGGGSGGGSVVLYAAKAANVTGTINVNGGLAGSHGQDNTLNDAKSGQNGQAGTIKIYQYNNAIAG